MPTRPTRPYIEKRVIGTATLYHADSFKLLPFLEKVDHIITDPPFSERTHITCRAGISTSRDGANRKDLGFDCLSMEQVEELASRFVELSCGWIVWMTDHVLCPIIYKNLTEQGRYVFHPLPYFAPGSRVRLTGDGPSSWTDWIMVARTKELRNWGTLPGGYLAGKGWNESKTKVGGKPTKLMEVLIKDYSKKNDLILDPFMGHGTTGVACALHHRRFIGIERAKVEFEVACNRIEEVQVLYGKAHKEKPQGFLF